MDAEQLAARLRERFTDVIVARGEVTVTLPREELLDALAYLRDEDDLGFDFLSDVSCTDWPGREPRMWMAYHLYAMARHHHRLRLKVGLAEADLRVPTVTGIHPSANWHEREVYDFFGVIFDGHPDLRRIELPEDWEGHPLRKDHPLGGVNVQYRGAHIPPPDTRGL